jgi:hypothetical protein
MQMCKSLSSNDDCLPLLCMLHTEVGITKQSLLNFTMADRECVVVSWWVSSTIKEVPHFFFRLAPRQVCSCSSRTSFHQYVPGQLHMIRQDKRLYVVLIASEPLTLEHPDLVTMPSNHNPQFAAVADGSDFDESSLWRL